MEKIEVFTKEVYEIGKDLPMPVHAYFIYTKNDGSQYILRAGLEEMNGLTGNIYVTGADSLVEYTKKNADIHHDWYDTEVDKHRPSVIIAQGEDLSAKFDLMRKEGSRINKAQYDYEIIKSNCNTTAAYLMRAAGIAPKFPVDNSLVFGADDVLIKGPIDESVDFIGNVFEELEDFLGIGDLSHFYINDDSSNPTLYSKFSGENESGFYSYDNKNIKIHLGENDGYSKSEVVQDVVSSITDNKHSIDGMINVSINDPKVGVTNNSLICGDLAEKILFEQFNGDNALLPRGVSQISCGQGDGDTGLLILEKTIYTDKDGASHDAISVVKALEESQEQFETFLVKNNFYQTAFGLSGQGALQSFTSTFARDGAALLNGTLSESEFLKHLVIDYAVSIGRDITVDLLNIGVRDSLKKLLMEGGHMTEKAAAQLTGAAVGGVASFAINLGLNGQNWDGEDYAKEGAKAITGVLISSVAASSAIDPTGFITLTNFLIDHNFTDFNSADLILLEAELQKLAVAGAAVEAAAAAAPLGPIAQGVVFATTYVGLTLFQGAIYKGRVFEPGQYGDKGALLDSIYSIQVIDGKNVMFVTDKEGASVGPWWNKPVDVLIGGIGGDILKATDGRDTQLLGKEGSDYLEGKSGNDVLIGGDDDDILRAGNGDDILLGGNGADFLVAGLGNDWADAGDGADVIYGGAGNDILYMIVKVEKLMEFLPFS